MNKKNIEDIFPLTDLQEALLLHRLQDGSVESGFLLLQGRITGGLCLERFREAWQETIDRHRALRTSIHWEGLAHPVQVVARKAEVRLEYLDWSGSPEVELPARIERKIEEEKQRGIDLSQSPVDRLILIRTEVRSHRFIWICHHILLDGWSSAIVLNEVFSAYHRDDHEPAESKPEEIPFKDYVTWLDAQDRQAPERFWSDYLRTENSVLATSTPDPGSTRRFTSRCTVAESVSSQDIAKWARARRVTANCLFQGAWALLLAEWTGSMQPVFGITVSGRGAPMKGIESMVGMFANTLPVVLGVNPKTEVDPWFKDVFKRQMAVQRYEHCPLGRILDWGGISLRRPLFDSLIVFANFPFGGQAGNDRPDAIELVDFQGDVTSSFPLTLIIRPGDALELEARYDPRCFETEDATAILSRFQALISRLVSGEAQTVGDLLTPGSPRRSGHASPDTLVTETASYNSDSERHLAQIWQDIVGVHAPPPDTDLFSIGGHSLAIPRLLARVNHDFGTDIEIGRFLPTPTIRHLSGLLPAGSAKRSWKTLVPIRPSGSKAPMIVLHQLAPGIAHVYDLARFLPVDQPVFAIQTGAASADSLEALAESCLQEIQAEFPSGPLQMAGLGFGGCVAYELACRLADSGRLPEKLILVDTLAPELARGKTSRPLVRMLRGIGRSKTDSDPDRSYDPTRVTVVSDADRAIAEHNLRLWRDYSPKPYAGRTCVIQSSKLPHARGLGWRAFVRGKVETTRFPGPPLLKLEDKQLRDLAAEISG